MQGAGADVNSSYTGGCSHSYSLVVFVTVLAVQPRFDVLEHMRFACACNTGKEDVASFLHLFQDRLLLRIQPSKYNFMGVRVQLLPLPLWWLGFFLGQPDGCTYGSDRFGR
jgi:hypothetical protein